MMNTVSPLSDHVCGDCTRPSQTDPLILRSICCVPPMLDEVENQMLIHMLRSHREKAADCHTLLYL